METGTVKFYSVAKSAGVIGVDGGGEANVKLADIKGAGFRKLSPGQKVRFELVMSGKGQQAKNVEVVE